MSSFRLHSVFSPNEAFRWLHVALSPLEANLRFLPLVFLLGPPVGARDALKQPRERPRVVSL